MFSILKFKLLAVSTKAWYHACTVKTLPNLKPINSKISTLMRNGFVAEAQKVFAKMPERNTVTWNAMISGYFRNGNIIKALQLFDEMPERDIFSYNTMISGLTRNGLIRECHAIIEKSPFRDIVSQTNLIIGYFSIGEVVNAVKLFDLMPTYDTTVFNVMIFGLGENDHSEDGMKLFIRMKKGNLPLDESTYTSVQTICSNLASLDLGKQTHALVIKSGINCFIPVSNAMLTMYARCGGLDFALLEFFSMSNHDIISWNSIICGLAYHGHGEKALEMFKRMTLTKVKPNHITFVGVLSACSHTGLVEEGKYYFNIMQYEHLIKPTSEHCTCIIDLFSRFGLIHEAVGILKNMIADGTEVSASVWGALLGACRLHKEYEVGKLVGERMLELEPSNTGAYMILKDMYLQSGNKKEAANVLVRMKEKAVKKQPGCSWTEVNNGGHVFVAGESSHPRFQNIVFHLDLIYKEMDVVCRSKTGFFIYSKI
ncbi:pentatricopeptide repeat-containing protein At2g03880, mitochondrial-like [Rutidosis leptorrhynchoides]|uniref:pentatricopeptide repeat-containing protein At2g03880, mitochondrial-like n=1 Tax=Rutidosis leptorrhynchoides TaxID=125765 RepID=UPI003A99432C